MGLGSVSIILVTTVEPKAWLAWEILLRGITIQNQSLMGEGNEEMVWLGITGAHYITAPVCEMVLIAFCFKRAVINHISHNYTVIFYQG